MKPCGDTVTEASKLITKSNDNIQKCLQNGLTMESVCLNFTLMNLPTEIKNKMMTELNSKCPSFKLTTEQFNKAFELVVEMVEENTSLKVVSVYNSAPEHLVDQLCFFHHIRHSLEKCTLKHFNAARRFLQVSERCVACGLHKDIHFKCAEVWCKNHKEFGHHTRVCEGQDKVHPGCQFDSDNS